MPFQGPAYSDFFLFFLDFFLVFFLVFLSVFSDVPKNMSRYFPKYFIYSPNKLMSKFNTVATKCTRSSSPPLKALWYRVLLVIHT